MILSKHPPSGLIRTEMKPQRDLRPDQRTTPASSENLLHMMQRAAARRPSLRGLGVLQLRQNEDLI